MKASKSAPRLTDAQLKRVAEQFRLLSEPMRLKILQALCKQPLSVGEIVTETGATQSNISRHLSLLAAAGIITRRKDGQFVYYETSGPLAMKLCQLVHQATLRQL